MNARWMNAEIATCGIAGREANWPRGQSRPWKGHIVIVLDWFLILSRLVATRQWKGSLTVCSNYLENNFYIVCYWKELQLQVIINQTLESDTEHSGHSLWWQSLRSQREVHFILIVILVFR